MTGDTRAIRDVTTPMVCLVVWLAVAIWVRPDRIATHPLELPIALTIGGGIVPFLSGRRVAIVWFLGVVAVAIAYQLWALDLARSLGVEVADLRDMDTLEHSQRALGRRAAYLTTAAFTAWLILLRRCSFPRPSDRADSRSQESAD